ncbi:hypothetical protein AVEN_176425-1 [Araneus ventricosus]|uniref:Uncharacterized protein n=1 Tax=Araneus ventricosus TaxID=182803 RepID=A0A4Y2C6V2_ARAVE|nr:hypothetical protein AVEN_176425-1 [Araneus ventricosus]
MAIFTTKKWPKTDFSADENEIALKKKRKIISFLININANDLSLTCFSSYRKTIKLVSWICRFVQNCKHQNKKKDELTVSEINEAESFLIRLIEYESFHGIEDKWIISLNPFIDHGIVRAKTAVFQRDDISEFRTHAILPSDHSLVRSLVIEEQVERTYWSFSRPNFSKIKILDIRGAKSCFIHFKNLYNL